MGLRIQSKSVTVGAGLLLAKSTKKNRKPKHQEKGFSKFVQGGNYESKILNKPLSSLKWCILAFYGNTRKKFYFPNFA